MVVTWRRWVGLDCANGSASAIAKNVFDALGAETYVINNEPNGLVQILLDLLDNRLLQFFSPLIDHLDAIIIKWIMACLNHNSTDKKFLPC